jgi:DNA-binding transcriptional MerR regulator
MADDERRGATAALTTVRATATAHPVTVSVRETWADWFPESDPTLPIGKLLEHTHHMGIEPVDQSTLRFWQKVGILPHPVRRKTGTGLQAVYPTVALAVIERIRNLQKVGLTLKEIRPLIRGMVATWNDPDPLGIKATLLEAAEKQHELAGVPIARVTVTFTDSVGTEISYQYHPDAETSRAELN